MLVVTILHLHKVGLLQTTFCVKARQEPLFQVHHSFTNQIVSAEVVVIHDLDLQILYLRYGRFKLERPTCKVRVAKQV